MPKMAGILCSDPASEQPTRNRNSSGTGPSGFRSWARCRAVAAPPRPGRRWPNGAIGKALAASCWKSPTACPRVPDRLDCFARSTDQAMWHRWWDGGQWAAWEKPRRHPPRAARLRLLGAEPHRLLRPRHRPGAVASGWDGRQWGGWENLGGILLEQPDCVSWGPSRIDCFARGTDQAMWHRWLDGTQWGGWESLGGILLEQPDCVSWGANRLDCFARGTDRAMWHRWWDGAQWGGWESLGGILLEQPDPACPGARPPRLLRPRHRPGDVASLVGRTAMGRLGQARRHRSWTRPTASP